MSKKTTLHILMILLSFVISMVMFAWNINPYPPDKKTELQPTSLNLLTLLVVACLSFVVLNFFKRKTKMNENQFEDLYKMHKKTVLVAFFITLGSQSIMTAQTINNSVIYIQKESSLYIPTGAFTFGNGSTTITNRGSGTDYGKIIFGETASVDGATSGSGLFVNGFANTQKNGFFILPIGDSTTYAPLGVTNSNVINGVDAAYLHVDPTTVGTSLEAPITALLPTGFWQIKGDNAKITLIWDSNISSLSNNINDLTVAGYNNLSGKWEEIISDTAIGTLTTGTIATTNELILSDYSAFTIAVKSNILNSEIFNNNTIFASLNHDELKVNSLLPINEVTIYDITGRLVMNRLVNSKTTFQTTFNQPQTVYIVKIMLDNGYVFTTKIINQN